MNKDEAERNRKKEVDEFVKKSDSDKEEEKKKDKKNILGLN